MDKKTLEKWLKAGFVERGHWYETEVGAPQGGTISPVLMNLTGRLFGRKGTVALMLP
jgi:RNA-directed DNA polymerase